VVFTNINTPRSAFPRNKSTDNLPTLVQRGASIGANTTIVCNHVIGQHAMIGAGSVVTKDVPPFALMYGNPARQHGWACQCGIVLTFAGGRAKCSECGRTYRQVSNTAIALTGAGQSDKAA
jgi:UDP-2-acetamido-3-amino-2,3-dideoxy-glucuronate N-acetyltransferase